MFFFRRGKKTRKSRPVAQARRLVRRLPLSLELLEGRILLSQDIWQAASGNWDVGSNWSLGHAPGTGDTALINTNTAATITIQSGDNIQVQSVTTGANDTLSMTGGSLTITTGTSTLSGALSMSGGSLGITGSGVSLTANGSTTIANASLYAENGATLSLPQLTSYTAENNTFEANGAGSVLDVSALASTTIKGNWSLNAYNGATLKLTGMTGLSDSSEGGVYINDSGNSTLLDGNVVTLNGVNAALDGTDKHVADSWTKLTGSQLSITGGSYSLSSLTDVDNSSLIVSNGGSLALPGLTGYTAGSTTFQANGTGSVLDVSALTAPTIKGNWSINTYNGGEIKLTGLTSLSSSTQGGVYINDTGNSTLLDSNITTLNGVNATIANDAQVANSWTKFTNGQLTVTGGSYSLSGLTDVDGSNLIVNNGGSLVLPKLVSYVASGTYFEANGTGSVLDVSALTTPTLKGNWSLHAYNGGTLNITGLTSLSSSTQGGMYIDDRGNATLLDSNVTTLNGVNATLDGTDTKVANSWTKFTNGQLTITGGSYSLSGLTDVDGSNLIVDSGGSLALPGLVSYAAAGTFFEANGTGSVLDVSALTTPTIKGNWSLHAYNGGTLKVTGLTSLSSSTQGGVYIDDRGNATLLDSNVTTLNGVNATIADDAHVADSWTKFTNGQLQVSGGSYSLAGLMNVDGSNLYANNGGSLALPGLVSYASAGTVFEANGTGSVLDVSALTTPTIKGNWSLHAYNGGTLKITGLTSLSSSTQGGIYIDDRINSSLVDSNVTTLNGVNATIANDAHVADSWTKFTNGQLQVSGGSYSLAGLTNVDGSNLYANNGGSLALPGLVSYASAGTVFEANGTGSVLDVSKLTTVTQQGSWSIHAYNGGVVKLSSLANLTSTKGIYISVDGSSSTIDLSSLVSLTGPNSFTLTNGATLNLPVLTSGNVNLGNGSQITIRGNVVAMPADGTSGATINVPASQGLTITLQNTGTLTDTTINVGQGSTVALNGGKYLGTTTFNVAQNATADLTGGGTTNYGGTLTATGAGTVSLKSGGLDPATGGLTLNFSGSMFQWTGGAFFAHAGDVTNLGTMNLAGSNDKGFYEDATLDNKGTIIQTGTGNLGLHSDNKSPTTLLNEAGASYLIEGDGGFDNPFGGQVAVQNAGTLKKTAGTGTSQLYINGALSNTGVIESDSGTLFMDPKSFTQVSSGTLTGGTWNELNGAGLGWSLAPGTITANEGSITDSGKGSVGNLLNLSSNSGSLTISDGALLTTAAGFTNSGSVTIGPGSTITDPGGFTQTSTGTLNVQIGGTQTSGLFGQLAMQNTANLGGALNVSLVNGFSPGSGQDYKVMTFASASGNFATVTGLGTALTEQLNPTSLDLTSTATNPVTLGLTSVTAPTAATTGQPITVNWQVSNSSSNAATGNWQDSVFLSTTPTITGSSILLGSVTHTGGIAANGSYNASLTTVVPALPPGSYYILVQTDSLYQVAVTSRANDIMAASTGQLAVTVPALALGTPAQGTFTAANQDQYYQITVPAGGSLQLSLTSAASSGALALYVSQGTPPTPYSYQETAKVANQPNQSLNVPVTTAGTYYILVHSVSGAAATAGYTLTVSQTNAVSVTGISSYAGGNAGTVTIEIDGTNFTPQTTASLTLGSTTINASAIDFVRASKLFATFNLTGATAGGYTLSVQQGTQSATAASKFQVVASAPNNGLLDIKLDMPQHIRAGRTGTVVITYTNTSNNDIVAPLLDISSTNPNIFFSTLDDPNDFVQQDYMLAVAPYGPAGILRPGQSGQITLTLLTEGTGGAKIPLSVDRMAPGQTLDWGQFKTSTQPSGIPTSAWNTIFNNLMGMFGTTTDSYQSALAQSATYLGDLGDSTAQLSDVNKLWSFLIAQADAEFPTASLASAVDASLPTPGNLPFALDRTFQSTIAARYTPGIFGLGWSTSWQTSLSVDSSGNVTINMGGSFTSFFAKSNGTYLDLAGEYGTLTNSGSVYTYTDTSGSQYVFLANGNLNYVQDTNGNRVTLGYDASNKLVSLTYSNPADASAPMEQLTLTYNSQGFVSQVSDGTGNSWTYTYDSIGHLLSVAAPGSLTTTYTYDTGNNPETANALLSITNPDGSQFNFTYDSSTGRLSSSSRNNGANTVNYAYPEEAEVTATDATGDRFTFWFNESGKAARVQDPLGGISTGIYDSNGNLVGSTDAAGNSYHYSYDTEGNLTQIVNPVGQTVQMTYGRLGNLTSLTDAAGNTTQYKYNSAGNLLSITYPDKTQQSFSYDPLGNLSETVLQNGDPIDYQYNAQGLVTKTSFADGTSQTFTYDGHGNLLTASSYDSSGALTGTTTLTYNAANQLLSITYPNGQDLNFTYNAAGQRTQSVDQSGFTVNYAYDTLGRLSKLTDGSGNLIVQYSYGDIGQLEKKVNGNGTSTTYAYDQDGRLTQLVNYGSGTKVNSSFTYTYNSLGEQTSVKDAAGNITKYGYDSLGQLTQVTLPDGTNITYVYNAAGDRTEVLTNGTPTNYSSNADNEITQAGSTTYTYDANGNLKTATDANGTTTYNFNDLNQLVSITNPDGSVQNFQYSPLGFLVGTSTTSGGSTSQTNYLVDPNGLTSVVAAYNGSGSLLADYTYGIGLVSQTGPSGTGYYDFDANGNTIGITNSKGTYVNQYSYSPFGETIKVAAALPNPFTFAGEFGVLQTASNLFYMRARYYSPATGQFLSNDPIDLAGGDTNVRRYVTNNPIGLEDPTGLQPYEYPSQDGTIYNVNGTYYAQTGDGRVVEFPKGTTIAEDTDQIGNTYTKVTLPDGSYGRFRGFSDIHASKPPTPKPPAPPNKPAPKPHNGHHNPHPKPKLPATCSRSHKHQTQSFVQRITPMDAGGGTDCSGTTSDSGSSTASHDPNSIQGPAGRGLYVLSGALSYTVDFENDGNGPAQTVSVSEQLDPNFDWSTFQLGSFGFGPVKFFVPAGLTQYATTIAYQNPDGSSLDVNVNLNFNVQTGLLTVSFSSIDPLTGQAPTGAFTGFLPPDNSNGVGEGFVQYTVQPKAGLSSGSNIDAQASVVFDTNPALLTPTVVNKLDTAPPTSTVNPLPLTEFSPSFTVSWSGSDPTGPGIASYTIFVSDNGGTFTPWLTNTTQTAATYNGQVGHTYRFYSVAKDALGLVQPTPTGAQAVTTVSLSVPPSPPPPPPSPPPISLSAALAEGIPALVQGFAIDHELPQLISSAGSPSAAQELFSSALGLIGDEISLLTDVIMGLEAPLLGLGSAQTSALAAAIDSIVADMHANPLFNKV